MVEEGAAPGGWRSTRRRAGSGRRIARQADRLPVVLAEGLLVGALLRESLMGDDHAVVVVEGPEAVIEEPVRILAQRDPAKSCGNRLHHRL